MNTKTFYAMLGSFTLAAALVASPALAQGQGRGPGGGGPPGGGGGGGEETAGNNLSVPAIFVPDATGGPALRVPCGTYAVPGADGVPPSTVYPGYWLQQTEATWGADCATAPTGSVIADWGDNLTTRPDLAGGKPVRVEVSLLDPAAISMQGFVITNLTPDVEDRLATYGTRGETLDGFTTGTAGAPVTRVFDTGATLTIEQFVNGGWTTIYGPTVMTAEINSTGAVVYGFNWGSKGKRNTPATGTYRLTFTTVNTTITGIADTAALNLPTFTANSTSVTINLTSRSAPGGSGGGGRPLP
jgi:hypothetical protein